MCYSSVCLLFLLSLSWGFPLAGEPIPVVSEYKYLGFPMTGDGINFRQHVETQVSATAVLKFIQFQCSEWNPYMRYVIYTFLHPKLEYSAVRSHEIGCYQNFNYIWPILQSYVPNILIAIKPPHPNPPLSLRYYRLNYSHLHRDRTNFGVVDTASRPENFPSLFQNTLVWNLKKGFSLAIRYYYSESILECMSIRKR